MAVCIPDLRGGRRAGPDAVGFGRALRACMPRADSASTPATPGGSVLPRRELAWWLVCWLLVSAVVVGTGFVSRDPDSALHAAIADRLARQPPSRWVAPEWWGLWNSEGLYREHPAGIFLLPVVLAQLGLPAAQAAFVVGLSAALGSLWLIALIVSRLASRADGRAVLVLLQLMPVAFLFRVRANHEYPMLLCLLVAVLAVDGVRRSWGWMPVLAAALAAGLLVKGAFVAVVLVGLGAWVLVDPAGSPGPLWRPVAAIVAALVATVIVAAGYDAWYLRAAGESFWAGYWRRQLAPVTAAASTDVVAPLFDHAAFYVRVLVWWSAPWSAGLAMAAWRARGRIGAVWRALAPTERRGLLWVAVFVGLVMMLLGPASRFAERYVFSPTFALATVGVVVTCRTWPALARGLAQLDRRVPALPALLWLVLTLGRLGLGRFLPRI